jgi:branched-chain amino acid transport system substrate-binding protein
MARKRKVARKVARRSSRSLLKIFSLGAIVFVLIVLSSALVRHRLNTITIGLDLELTGEMQAVGQSSERGAKLAVAETNKKGGVTVAGKTYTLKLLVKDNRSSLSETKSVTEELANDPNVLAIVGPNASTYAMTAADVAEKEHIVLISPWSTNPATTRNSDGTARKHVFRAAFVDSFQGKALAQFASKELNSYRAAVLADDTAQVLVGQANFFKDTFTGLGGTIVASEVFKSQDTDVTTKLRAIANSSPDLIFLPAYAPDAARIVKAARSLGIQTPFLGSDAWNGQEILLVCGSACDGSYVSAHYAADANAPLTAAFVQAYRSAYNSTPDDVAALTYDAIGLLARAIGESEIVSRESVVLAMRTISHYPGATGDISFVDSGDPEKSVVILQIRDGKFNWVANISP